MSDAEHLLMCLSASMTPAYLFLLSPYVSDSDVSSFSAIVNVFKFSSRPFLFS